MRKKAILSISFGSNDPESLQKNLGTLEEIYKQAHPDCGLYRAITNDSVIRIIQDEGISVYAVRESMARAVLDGVTHLYVQPAYMLNGTEYEEMVDMVMSHRADFVQVMIGRPLLSSHEDYVRVCKSIMEDFGSLGEDEAVVLIGHGSDHDSNSAYCTLDYIFKDLGYENTHVGTFNSYPQVDTVIRHLKKDNRIRKVHVAPFMFVAGKAAMEGVCGDSADSITSILRDAGYEVITHRKCLGEYEGVRRVYADHLERCFE